VKFYSDPITEGARWLLAHLPFYVQWYRFNMFWRYDAPAKNPCFYRLCCYH
jgi:hypothetical protein